ncbi:MAG: hypothetical protein ACM3TU_01680 [Bacillota bacterium]
MKSNEFFDINKFPRDWGIIVLPISMSRIGNAQSAQACIDALDFFLEKIDVNRVGANFLYSEGLYMNFEKDAHETKNRFANSAVSHMGAVRNLVAKNHRRFQIDHAFSFESWFQMYLSHKDFFSILKSVRKLYDADPEFQKWVAKDAEEHGKELTEQQLSFYLEEHTWEYLLINRELTIRNDFVNGREQWVMCAYPGRPARGQIYLVQQDPLKLNCDSNPYKGQYDLSERKFIDYLKVDLETF